MFKTIAFVSALIAGVEAGFGTGGCPSVTLEQNFDAERYQGQWFEATKDKLTWFELTAKCVTSKYETQDDGPIKASNGAY